MARPRVATCCNLFVLRYPTLSSPTLLPYFTLPHFTLVHPTIPDLTLPHPDLPYSTLPYLRYPTLPYPSLAYSILPYPTAYSSASTAHCRVIRVMSKIALIGIGRACRVTIIEQTNQVIRIGQSLLFVVLFCVHYMFCATETDPLIVSLIYYPKKETDCPFLVDRGHKSSVNAKRMTQLIWPVLYKDARENTQALLSFGLFALCAPSLPRSSSSVAITRSICATVPTDMRSPVMPFSSFFGLTRMPFARNLASSSSG